MPRKKQSETADSLLTAISEKLRTIEHCLAWTIHADQRFEIGQRVEFSRHADEQNISRHKRGGRRGIIKAIGWDNFTIYVQLDGHKTTSRYHHSFFNPISGPKLF